MTSSTESLTDELSSSLECCICFDCFRDPRTLPCIHTFCLHCLKHLTREMRPGDWVRCPLCNRPFAIPAGGIDALPGNPFVSRILEIRSSSRRHPSGGEYDPENRERERLKRNAERASCLLADGMRCVQMTDKTLTSVLTKQDAIKEAIARKIGELSAILDDMQTTKARMMDVLDDEREDMDGHLAILASYRSYCRNLVETESASEIGKELDALEKQLHELEEIHETRVKEEFKIQGWLLDELVTDSVVNSSLLNSNTEKGQDSADENLLTRKHSTHKESEEPERKRPRIADSEDSS